MAKTHSGGGKTPRNVGVKTGPPSANKIDPGSASRIGRSVGNHTERGTTKRPAEPLVTGSMKQVPLGNTVALNGSGSGARPGGGVVADGRRSEMHRLVPPVPVSLPDAERVVTAGAGAGWTNCPKVDDWKPPGLAIMDQLMDHQDALDRRERERKLRGR
jgi:hypothetical protein